MTRVARVACMALWAALLTAGAALGQDVPRIAPEPLALVDALYPEGPVVIDDRLYFAEMTADRVSRLVEEDGVWRRETWLDLANQSTPRLDCGPTALAPMDERRIVVLCHLAGVLLIVERDGRLIDAIGEDVEGRLLTNPNDVHVDRAGGAIFSDPGPFAPGGRAVGLVYRLNPDLTVTPIARGIRYSNGVAVAPSGGRALFSEHLGQRLFEIGDIDAPEPAPLLDRDALGLVEGAGDGLVGPDGVEFETDSRFWVAFYGDGRIARFDDGARTLDVVVPQQFVTNVALWGDRLVVVGAYDNRNRPYPGAVAVFARDELR